MYACPTVYLLCGFIGALRITKDEWLLRLIGDDPTIDGCADFDHSLVELSPDVAFRLVGKGIDGILGHNNDPPHLESLAGS